MGSSNLSYLYLTALQLWGAAPLPACWWLQCFWTSSCVRWWACLSLAHRAPPAGRSSYPESLLSIDSRSPSSPPPYTLGPGCMAALGASKRRRLLEIWALRSAEALASGASLCWSRSPLELLCWGAAATGGLPVRRTAGWSLSVPWAPAAPPAVWERGALQRLTDQKSFFVLRSDEQRMKEWWVGAVNGISPAFPSWPGLLRLMAGDSNWGVAPHSSCPHGAGG